MRNKSIRLAYILGIFSYIIMCGLALVYYRERTILLDASYALFHMLMENGYSIEFHRFPDAIVQTLPLWASRAGWSLTAVMKLYSLSFVLFFFVCYVITGSVLKRKELALVILLLNTALVTETFFYTPSQLPQGIAFLIMLFAALSRIRSRAGDEFRHAEQFFLAVAGAVILAFFHPLMLFPMAFLIAYFYLRQRPVAGKEVFLVLILSFVAITVFKSVLFHTKYERQSLSGLKNFYLRFPNYIRLYSNKVFLQYCCTRFIAISIMLLADIYVYYKKNEKLKLCLLLAGFFGYLLLINITYPDKITPGFYRENLYLPLALMLGLPFVLDFLPSLPRFSLVIPVFGVMVGLFVLRVWLIHPRYTARVDWVRRTAYRYQDRKLVITRPHYSMDTLQMIWGTPYEFWLLSSSEMGRVVSVFVDDRPDKQMWLANTNKSFYVNWNLYDYTVFPKNKYFVFPDTLTGYGLVDTVAERR